MPVKTRKEAEEKERILIKHHRPKYNVIHNSDAKDKPGRISPGQGSLLNVDPYKAPLEALKPGQTLRFYLTDIHRMLSRDNYKYYDVTRTPERPPDQHPEICYRYAAGPQGTHFGSTTLEGMLASIEEHWKVGKVKLIEPKR